MGQEIYLHPEIDGKPSPSRLSLGLAAAMIVAGAYSLATGGIPFGIVMVAFGATTIVDEMNKVDKWESGYRACMNSVVDQLPEHAEATTGKDAESLREMVDRDQ